MRNKIIQHIFEIADKPNDISVLEKEVSKYSKPDLFNSIIQVGILPECFGHDTTEEKIWSKYSDILLAQCLNNIGGIEAKVLGTRGNSADVIGHTNNYSMVADAKTFRLSRTAKNQKDYKVSALDSWRGGNNFSMLVGPLFQYPKRESQIYKQAITRNVTLYSYTHLKFVMGVNPKTDLKPIFDIGSLLKKELTGNEQLKAASYWSKIDEITLKVTGSNAMELEGYKQETIKTTQGLGNKGVSYWNNIIEEIKKLPREEAIKELIKARKIDQKIKVIKKAINGLNMYNN